MLIRLQDGIRLGGGGDIENLNDLADVAITAPTSGQVLAYDGDKWINTTGGGTAGVSSFNGRTGIVTPQAGDYTKSDVGLGNVDNTSDLNKPISTATQNALNLKANASDIPAPYNLPKASSSTLGGIKVGNNLTIDADGTLNASGGGGGGSDDIWLPTVSEQGVISWQKSSTSTVPTARNIKGQAGQDGQDGADGNGISGITKTGSSGLVDTYTITFTNGTTTTFTVTNGAKGDPGDDYVLTNQDKTDIATIVLGMLTIAENQGV